MLKEESTGVETESSGGCFYEGLWLKRKNSSSGAWGARPLSSGGGGREPEEIWPCGILSLSISNDWLKLGIKWVNKHLKWSEFNQMWIVLDGFFLASAIWCLAQWKPSFLWFLVYSSTAMKNSLRLKDFCANGKKKKKEQTPGTMALPAVVTPFTCLLSTVFGPNPVPVCTLRLSAGQITSEVGQDQ